MEHEMVNFREMHAKSVIRKLNSLMTELPDFRIVSHGTRAELRPANGQYHDAGLDYVAEFARAFDAHIGKDPEIPAMRNFGMTCVAEAARKLLLLAGTLKADAATTTGIGDEGSALNLIRLQLIVEEVGELAEAIVDGDIVECLDALGDISYVVDGTYLTLGLGHYKLAALAEIHRSNMSKLDADGKPIIADSGRVVKSDRYSPPDLSEVLALGAPRHWEEKQKEPPAAASNKLPDPQADDKREKLVAFYNKLQYFDWWYMMSDDGLVYTRGISAIKELDREAEALGPEGVKLKLDWTLHVYQSGPKPSLPGEV